MGLYGWGVYTVGREVLLGLSSQMTRGSPDSRRFCRTLLMIQPYTSPTNFNLLSANLSALRIKIDIKSIEVQDRLVGDPTPSVL